MTRALVEIPVRDDARMAATARPIAANHSPYQSAVNAPDQSVPPRTTRRSTSSPKHKMDAIPVRTQTLSALRDQS